MELADRAAQGHEVSWRKLHDVIDRGWLEARPGYVASVTEIPAPPFNGVTVYGAFDRGDLSGALGRVAVSGYPFSLQARPAVAARVAKIAREFRMVREPAMPLMATTVPPTPPTVVDGLALRQLPADEGDAHARVAAEAFGAPLRLMRMLATPTMLRAPGVHVFLGECDGGPVATAIADVNGESTGIFNVATREAYRGRGIGAAITAAAVRAAFDDGTDLAFLLSSPMGEHVYASLGFRTVEPWSMWASAARA